MIDSELMSKMISLNKRFHKEVENVDAIHTNVSCDFEFLQKYLKAHTLWVTYSNLPESNVFKIHFLGLLIEAMESIESFTLIEEDM